MTVKLALLLAAVLPAHPHDQAGEKQPKVHKRPTAHEAFVTERHHLPGAVRAMLRRLRGCETRGIAYPANYRYSGHHHGAYQYTVGTWLRTIPYLPRRLRRFASHGPAHTASPAEQDVRTAYFFPSHRGEWACKP